MNNYTTFKSHEQFLSARNTGIGSSDIPTLAGLNAKYGSTAMTLWEQKTGRSEGFTGNMATEWGHLHETNILYMYIKNNYGADTADKFLIHKITNQHYLNFKNNTEARHPDYPYFIAHADLLIDENGGHIQEAKSARMMAGKRRDDDDYGYSADDLTASGIPLSVFLQVQWQLLCYGAESAGVSVLIDTSDYREYGTIYPDKKTQEKLMTLAERFWHNVKTDTPPKPIIFDDVKKLFPDVQEEAAICTIDSEIDSGVTVADMLSERDAINKKIKELKLKEDDIKKAIGLLIGDNKTLMTPDGTILATRSMQSRESISVAELRKTEYYDRLNEDGLVKKSEYPVLRIRGLKR